MIPADNPASSASRHARSEAEAISLVGGADPSRWFVPLSVPRVTQLMETTGKADGLLSRMVGGSSPPRRANTPMFTVP